MESRDVDSNTLWRYAYDSSGERIARWTTTGGALGLEMDVFIRNDGGQVLSEWHYDADVPSLAPTREYVLGHGVLAQMDVRPGGTGLHYLVHDHLGSGRVLLADNGAIAETYDFLPFGEFTDTSASSPSTTKLFTGHERDLGLYGTELDYMHARYYSGTVMVFISVDPKRANVHSSQSWNRYQYALRNPISLVDPDGMETAVIFHTEGNPYRGESKYPWGHVEDWAVQHARDTLGSVYNELDVVVYEVEHVSEVENAIQNNEDIVYVVFIGHSSESRISIGNENEPDTNISTANERQGDVDPATLDWGNLVMDPRLGHQILLLGCNAGNESSGNSSVAQDLADATGVPVKAAENYTNFRDDGTPFIRFFRAGGWRVFSPEGDTALWLEQKKLQMRQAREARRNHEN
jgi:RHS repeat-associated protein